MELALGLAGLLVEWDLGDRNEGARDGRHRVRRARDATLEQLGIELRHADACTIALRDRAHRLVEHLHRLDLLGYLQGRELDHLQRVRVSVPFDSIVGARCQQCACVLD